MKMKTKVLEKYYSILSPYQIIREDGSYDKEELNRHFDDISKLFLKRLSDFGLRAESDELSDNQLVNLLNELIETKRLLSR